MKNGIFCIALGLLLATPLAANAASSKNADDKTKVAATTDHGSEPAAKEKSEDSHSGSSWTYSGKKGPAKWGKLDKDYHVCGAGAMQSPIDLSDGFGATGDPITFDYRLTALDIVNNGHTIQVNYEPGSGITVGGEHYELLQLHFHTPSEHTVNHKPAAMEVHFVHKNAEGALAVVGALLETGADNRALREVWAKMPKKAGPSKTHDDVMLNARDFLPSDTNYYRYMGSLTTPPCSEGVNWFVLLEPLTIGADQVARFAKLIGDNARPVQHRNHRLVLAPSGGTGSVH